MDDLALLVSMIRSVVDDPQNRYQPPRTGRRARLYQREVDAKRRARDARAAEAVMAWAAPSLAKKP